MVEPEDVSLCSEHDQCALVKVSGLIGTGLPGDWHFRAHAEADVPHWVLHGPNGQEMILPVSGSAPEPLVGSIGGVVLAKVAVKIAETAWSGWRHA